MSSIPSNPAANTIPVSYQDTRTLPCFGERGSDVDFHVNQQGTGFFSNTKGNETIQPGQTVEVPLGKGCNSLKLSFYQNGQTAGTSTVSLTVPEGEPHAGRSISSITIRGDGAGQFSAVGNVDTTVCERASDTMRCAGSALSAAGHSSASYLAGAGTRIAESTRYAGSRLGEISLATVDTVRGAIASTPGALRELPGQVSRGISSLRTRGGLSAASQPETKKKD